MIGFINYKAVNGFNGWKKMPLAGLEPAANGLGNHCSIHTEL